MKHIFFNLRFRLILLVLFAVIPALGLTLYTGLEQRRIIADEAKDELLRLTRFISTNQSQLLEGTRHFLYLLAHLSHVQNCESAPCRSLFANLLKRYPWYFNIGAAFPDGNIFAGALPMAKTINIADRSYFRLALKECKFAIGDYQIGRSTGKPAINFGHPVIDEGGKVKAVVFVALRLDWLNQLSACADLPRGSTVTVINHNGIILGHHPNPENWIGKCIKETTLVKTILSNREGVVEDIGIDGVSRLYAFTIVGDTGRAGNMYLSIGIPTPVAFAEVNKILKRNLFLLLFIGVIALVAIWVGGNLLVLRRLNPILSAAKRLGDGDLTVRTGIPYGKGELSQLAFTFDEMARSLERHEIEYKQAEEALRESEEIFRLFMEHSPIYVFFKDEHIRSMKLSKNYEKMLGRPLPELIGKTMCDLFPSELAKSMVEDDLSILREGKPIEVVEELNGRIYTTTKFPIIREGKPSRLAGFTMDITEAKLAEKALRESEERFRTIFNGVNDAIFVCDLTAGAILDVNQRMTEIYGYTREEALRLNIGTISAGEPPYTEQDALKRIYKAPEGEPQVFEWLTKDKAGRLFWIDVDMRLVTIGDQERLLVTVRDITKRKQAEEELQREQSFTNAVLNSIPGVLYLYDDQYHLVRWNKKLEEISGYSVEELSHMHILDWVEGEDKALIASAAQRVFKEGQASVKANLVTKGGKKIPFYFTGVSLIIGDCKYLTGIGLDLTEYKRAEEKMASLQEELRQSQKLEAIGRLAGGIAHDFNNALTVIKGYSQLSLIELKEEIPLRKKIEEIQNAAEQAAHLTRQLLAFSRRQILDMKVLDLNIILRDMEKMLRRIIGEDIDLVTFLADDIGRIMIDPGQIGQVVMNLAANARDAIPNGGKLTIETANVILDEEYARNHVAVKPGDYVMLAVSDTGSGITAEVKERIFEPFFTTKEKSKGTGLGLSTVYGIIKQSGGNIWVYSEPEHGTTFKIYLPRVNEPLEQLREKAKVEEIPRGDETILIVEDDEAVRKLAAQILKRQGYTVLEADQEYGALLLCKERKEPIHLILADVVMPKKSGRQLIESLKQVRNDFKSLYMSGYTNNVIVHHGILEKGIDFIQKPFTFEGLARKVREVLDK